MHQLVFVDDFGSKEVDKTMPVDATKEALQGEAEKRNQSIDDQGLEEYGHWYVRTLRARDQRGRKHRKTSLETGLSEG